MGITEAIEELINSLDQKKFAIGMFIDLKKHLKALIIEFYSAKLRNMKFDK